MVRVKPYLGIARAPFLLLPVTLVLCGAGAAAYEGAVSWTRSLLALVALVAVHVSVNALNEWSDMKRGIDLLTVPTPFSGGSGTLPRGEAPPVAALGLGLASAGLGLLIGLWFLKEVGWGFLPFLLVGGVFVLGYTDALARMGVGEIAAGLGLGGLAVSGTAFVQDGSVGASAVAASVPAFLMTFNLLLLNEFPDEEADRKGGRRNLVLMFGRPRAASVYALAALLTPSWILAATLAGTLPWYGLLGVFPSLLLVGPLRWAFSEPEAAVPIPAMGSNVIWNLATNTLLGAGLFLAAFL